MSERSDPRNPLARELAGSTAAIAGVLTALDDGQLPRRPAPAEWNAWDIAYHVAQIEVWYFAKLCEAVSADRVEAMSHFVAAWQHLRREGIALAAGIQLDRLDRTGLLGGVPEWTPRQLIERMIEHDREHIGQISDAVTGDVGEQPNAARDDRG